MLILYFCSIIAVITAFNAGPGEHSKMVKDLNELMKERVKDYEASRGGETQIDAVKYHVERDSHPEELLKKQIGEEMSSHGSTVDQYSRNLINKILEDHQGHEIEKLIMKQGDQAFQQDSAETQHAEVIGKGFYLPTKDIKHGIFTGGLNIFKSIPSQCVDTEKLAIFEEKIQFYEDTASFMTSVSTSTGISASYRSTFFLGVTVDVTTKNVDQSHRQIRGSSLVIRSLNKQDFLKDDCIDSLELDSTFINDFKSLSAAISDPSKQSSWFHYNNFIKRYGTHLIKVVRYGNSLTQETYSKKSSNYSLRDYTVKACVDFSGGTGTGNYEAGACSGVSNSEEESSQSFSMNSHLVVKGGSTETRNALIHDRSASRVEAFLNAGKRSNSPVEYDFYSIAELLLNRFATTGYVAQALNLRSFIEGFLSFGCAPPKNDNPRKLRLFSLASSNPTLPEYKCSIPAAGCNNDNDCHYNAGNVVCEEYGSTAIAHGKETLPNGKVKPYAYTKGNDGGNNHCWYTGWFDCYCESYDKTRKVIWESGVITTKANKMRALLDQ